MAIQPVVRYMIPCEDWHVEADNPRRITIVGLISYIDSLDDPPYPLLLHEICVFLLLTGGRGNGRAKIRCIFEESGQTAFETPWRSIEFGPDPVDIANFGFRIHDCPFPRAGVYSIQFWFDGELIEERPIKLR